MIPRNVNKGDAIRASDHNAMLEELRSLNVRLAKVERGVRGGSTIGEPAQKASVWNNTGGDLPPRSIVALGEQVLSSDESDLSRRVITGGMPDDSVASFAIYPDGVSDGEVADAYCYGICQCTVDVTDVTHVYANPTDGETGYLTSGSSGLALILDREGGTGQQWAIVQWPVGGGGGGDTRWVSVTAESVTDDEILVIEDEQSIQPGTPIRWNEATVGADPDYRYGIITSATPASGSTLYTYAGPPMTNYATIWRDQYQLSTLMHLFVEGDYSAPTESDLLWNLHSVRVRWQLGPAALVQISACQGGNSTTTQPIINVSIDDSYVSTSGVQMVSSSFVSNDATDIDPDAYEAEYGDIIKLAVTTAGTGATEAKDLSVQLIWVTI